MLVWFLLVGDGYLGKICQYPCYGWNFGERSDTHYLIFLTQKLWVPAGFYESMTIITKYLSGLREIISQALLITSTKQALKEAGFVFPFYPTMWRSSVRHYHIVWKLKYEYNCPHLLEILYKKQFSQLGKSSRGDLFPTLMLPVSMEKYRGRHGQSSIKQIDDSVRLHLLYGLDMNSQYPNFGNWDPKSGNKTI